MIPMQMGALEHDVGNDAEDCQRDTLLDNLQLDEVERTTILNETNAIGWYLTTIFKEGDAPREADDADKRPMAGCACLL